MRAADFRLLGPLVIAVNGRPVRVSAAKQRILLGVLLVNANKVVRADRLLHELWLESPPKSGMGTLHSLISRLRGLLTAPAVRLERAASGYRVNVLPEVIDSYRFEQLGGRGRAYAAEGQVELAARTLSDALAIWRGDFLIDVPHTPLIVAEATRLQELRVDLTELRLEMDLRLRRHAHVVTELRSLVADHPYRERLWHQLMHALYQSGRAAEALEEYGRARAVFVDELGLEPSDSLRTLHQEILRGAVAPLPGAAASARIMAPVTPRQLPSAIGDFVGRAAELSAIDRHLRRTGHALPLVVVSGMPGAGKTALAVRAAHEVADRFPDGQLFVHLNGTSSRPTDPADVLTRLLASLGVSAPEIPPDLAGRADLFRCHVSGRRILIVLDDAADEFQVKPLLPGSPKCAVVITARRRLALLEGAGRIEVGPLTREESVEFVQQTLDEKRTAAEPAAVSALADVCADLPLSLRICTARLTANPHWTLSSLLTRLERDQTRLKELRHGSLRVEASFASSYEGLAPPAQRLFRGLGTLEMPDFPVWTGAALLDVSPPHAQQVFDTLVEARLLEAIGSGDAAEPRYRLHRLAGDYSRLRACEDRDADAANRAIGRILGGWLRLVEQGCWTAFGADYMVSHGTASRWSPSPSYFKGLVADPWTRLETERPSIVAAVCLAARHGMDELCWDLATTSTTLFGTGGYLDDWQHTHDVALAAVREAANERGEAAVMRHIGGLRIFQGRYADANAWLTAACAAFRRVGDVHGEALAIFGEGITMRKAGRYATALRCFQSASAKLRSVGDHLGVAHTLRHIGQIHLAMADFRRARRKLSEALEIVDAEGCLPVEGHVRQCLGEVMIRMGQYAEAIECFTCAAEIAERVRDRQGQERALHWAARAHLLSTERSTTEASSYLSRAFEIAQGIGDRKRMARFFETMELAKARDLPLSLEM